MPNKYEQYRRDREVFYAGAHSMLSEMRDMQARYKLGWARYLGDQNYARELQAKVAQREFELAKIAAFGEEQRKTAEMAHGFKMEEEVAGEVEKRKTALFGAGLAERVAETERQRQRAEMEAAGMEAETYAIHKAKMEDWDRKLTWFKTNVEYMSEVLQDDLLEKMLADAKAQYPAAEIVFAGIKTMPQFQDALKQAEDITVRRSKERARLTAIASATTGTVVDGATVTDGLKEDAKRRIAKMDAEEGQGAGGQGQDFSDLWK